MISLNSQSCVYEDLLISRYIQGSVQQHEKAQANGMGDGSASRGEMQSLLSPRVQARYCDPKLLDLARLLDEEPPKDVQPVQEQVGTPKMEQQNQKLEQHAPRAEQKTVLRVYLQRNYLRLESEAETYLCPLLKDNFDKLEGAVGIRISKDARSLYFRFEDADGSKWRYIEQAVIN